MATNYVLIDFENVQPKNLEILAEHPFKVYVFVGANQTKVSFDQAAAMQAMGEDAKYIKIAGNGPNALDFHIAFYIGELSMRDPMAKFNIISKDTGFDPLIKHPIFNVVDLHPAAITSKDSQNVVLLSRKIERFESIRSVS